MIGVHTVLGCRTASVERCSHFLMLTSSTAGLCMGTCDETCYDQRIPRDSFSISILTVPCSAYSYSLAHHLFTLALSCASVTPPHRSVGPGHQYLHLSCSLSVGRTRNSFAMRMRSLFTWVLIGAVVPTISVARTPSRGCGRPPRFARGETKLYDVSACIL